MSITQPFRSSGVGLRPSDQVATHCPDSGLRSIRDVNLAQDVLHMLLDRLDAGLQRPADFLVAQPQRHVPQHLAFPLSERYAVIHVGALGFHDAGHALDHSLRTPLPSPPLLRMLLSNWVRDTPLSR